MIIKPLQRKFNAAGPELVGLVSYWPFDSANGKDPANDIVGSYNLDCVASSELTIPTKAEWVQDHNGVANQAFQSKVFYYSFYYPIPKTFFYGPHTLTGWIKIDTYEVNRVLFCIYETVPTRYAVRLYSDTQMEFLISHAVSTYNSVFINYSVGTWYKFSLRSQGRDYGSYFRLGNNEVYNPQSLYNNSYKNLFQLFGRTANEPPTYSADGLKARYCDIRLYNVFKSYEECTAILAL